MLWQEKALYFFCLLGNKSIEEHIEREQCSRVHLDAITSDDDGNIYAFRGEFLTS